MLCPDSGSAIPRERLFRALDDRNGKPITWLHAPAGAGKTTLLSTYLRARQVPVLWYDVDAGDADASSVFHYTRLGAEALLGGAVDLPVPRPGSPDGQRVFVRRFFEALFRQLPPGTHLVFDNYQDAASGAGLQRHVSRALLGHHTAREDPGRQQGRSAAGARALWRQR